MTDTLDLDGLFIGEFIKETEKRKEETGSDPTTWNAGGRASKAWPNKEDSTWWLTNGPEMVHQWHDWWTGFKAEGGSLWVTDTGVPAIELPVMATLAGQAVRGYIDAILVDPDGELVIVDWKTGREPIAPIQLGVYAAAVEKTLGVRPALGSHYLARKGDLGHVYDLKIYTEETCGMWLSRVADIEKRGNFVPHPSMLCGACSVKDYCLVMGGAKADQVPSF